MHVVLPSRRIIAKKAVLPDAKQGFIVAPATIDLQGETILAVYKEDAPVLPETVPTDTFGEDVLLSPAFIDGHTHVALSALRGHCPTDDAKHNMVETIFFHFESRIGFEDVRAFARMGAFEAILSGTAFIWDHYYHGLALAEAFQNVGIGAVIASTLQDLGGPGRHRHREALRETETIANATDLKKYGLFAALGPHATDTVSPRLFQEAAEFAKAENLPLHCHLAQSLDEVERAYEGGFEGPMGVLKAGKVLEIAPKCLWVHGVLLTEKDLKALNPAQNTLAFCPHSKEQFAFLPDVRHWEKQGIPWLVATDCAASNDAVDVQREMRFVAGMAAHPITYENTYQTYLKQGGLNHAKGVWKARTEARNTLSGLMDPINILKKVWSIPGGLHPQIKVGSLEGKALANLVIWDLKHPAFWPGADPLRALVYAKVSPAILQVMSAGRWLGERGNYHRSIRESDLYLASEREASKRLKALL